MEVKINGDLSRERELAKIPSEEFAVWWAGGAAALEQRRALEKLFYDDPEFEDSISVANLSHKELYEHTIIKSTKFLAKMRHWYAQQESKDRENGKPKSAIESMNGFRQFLTGSPGVGLFPGSFPLRLHYSMFMPTLLGQASDEQQRAWLDKAWNMDGWIGSYAQTELGHGTFLRGLQTRADYDAEREEFVLNTPTLSAYKWWPGGLGQTINVVVIMAQLYVNGKHCGLQPFLVRVRNEETHMPEPGVDIGEIGPKLGLNGVNNGFLGLRNVRIPRTQMLMRHAQVLPNGTFIKGPEPLLTYGAMVYVRVVIVRDVMVQLLQAATIATRYSIVRRQSPIELGQPEVQILDHLTQQAKVFPQIAKGVFYRLAADYVWRMYQSVMEELNAGNRRNLPELHALSCCLKAVCSEQAALGVDILRRACGGHGYLASSNFLQIFGGVTAACTYEGENTVLLLQTARFLVKNYMEGLKRKVLPKSVTYLRSAPRLRWSKDLLSVLVNALEITAAEKTRIAFEYQRQQKKLGHSLEMANNLSGLKLTQAASVHGHAFLARIALQQVQKPTQSLSPVLAAVMENLAEIFILDTFLAHVGDVLVATNSSPVLNMQRLAEIEQRYETALATFRPNAISVVDGFDFHDRTLSSTLGAYDGRVYERLMEEARNCPLNEAPVNRTFHTHLKPLMRGKL